MDQISVSPGIRLLGRLRLGLRGITSCLAFAAASLLVVTSVFLLILFDKLLMKKSWRLVLQAPADEEHHQQNCLRDTRDCQWAPRCCRQDPPTPSTLRDTQLFLRRCVLREEHQFKASKPTLPQALADDGLNLILLGLGHGEI